jgi:hypothetical protein
MNKTTYKNLKIGDTVMISNPESKNHGKLGIIDEIDKDDTGKIWRIYLKPLNCKFEFDIPPTKYMKNSRGFNGWSPAYLSLPTKKGQKNRKLKGDK